MHNDVTNKRSMNYEYTRKSLLNHCSKISLYFCFSLYLSNHIKRGRLYALTDFGMMTNALHSYGPMVFVMFL